MTKMKIIKRSEAENLHPKRYEIQIKRTPGSDWSTKDYADSEQGAIEAANWHMKFMVDDVRIIDNDS